jgi:hypothetical protein
MGETRGYGIKNGQNPNGVQYAISQIINTQKCSTLLGFVRMFFYMSHGFHPWLSIFNPFRVGCFSLQ